MGETSANDLTMFEQFISDLGFPIVICCVLLWYIYKQQKNHKEEIATLSDAINNNTLVMQKLIDKMDGSDLLNG